MYSSTALWRNGIGGQALTRGTCDSCWGSGDANRKGIDLRKLEADMKRLEVLESKLKESE